MTFGLEHRPFADFDDEVAPGTGYTVPPGAHASVGDEHSRVVRRPGRLAAPGKPARHADHSHPPRAVGPRSGPRGDPGAGCGRADGPGLADRDAVLCAHVLDHVPVLTVLDDFEDNLASDGDAGYTVRDEVLADLLAAWVADPGASRLPVTSRYPFTLPGGAGRALSFRQLGARCPGPRR